jgi:hypothetical protein
VAAAIRIGISFVPDLITGRLSLCRNLDLLIVAVLGDVATEPDDPLIAFRQSGQHGRAFML